MPEPVSDEHLRFALCDALRGLRLPLPHGKLAGDVRQMIADHVFQRLKQNGWQVVCTPSTGFAALYRGPRSE